MKRERREMGIEISWVKWIARMKEATVWSLGAKERGVQ